MRKQSLRNIARWLFCAQAAFWLIIGGISLARMSSNTDMPSLALAIIAGLMVANAAAMFWAAWAISQRKRWMHFLALGLAAVNAILSVTDEFGWIDFMTLLVNLVLVGLLLSARAKK